jgi:hypothetical protein
MKKVVICSILFLLLIIVGCYDDKLQVYEPPKLETARDIFYKIPGLYQVSDSAGNYLYQMRVAFFPDTIFENGIYVDSRDCVGVFNLDNQFDSLYFYYNSLSLSSISKRPVMLDSYYIENATKSDGTRWKVIDHFPDNLNDGDKMGWNKGVMWISFRLNNINYYQEDGISYGDTIKFQKAERIGN